MAEELAKGLCLNDGERALLLSAANDATTGHPLRQADSAITGRTVTEAARTLKISRSAVHTALKG